MSTVTFSTNMTYPQNTFPRKRFPTFFRLLAPRQLRVPTKLSACSLLQRGASETQSRTTPPGNPHIPIRRESPGYHSQAKVTADPRCTTIVSRNSMISGRIPGLRIPAIHRRPPQGPRGYQGISRVVMREVPTYLVGTEVHAHRQRVVDALQLFASKAEQFELSHSEGESIPDVLLERWEEVYLQNDPRFESRVLGRRAARSELLLRLPTRAYRAISNATAEGLNDGCLLGQRLSVRIRHTRDPATERGGRSVIAPNHQVEMDRRIRCAYSVPSALCAPAATHLGS